MMRLTPHQSLGFSLASVAVLSGSVAISLGWMTPGRVRAADTAGAPAPVVRLAAPPVVRVSVLPTRH